MTNETYVRTKPSPLAQLRSRGALCRTDRRLSDLLATAAETYLDLSRAAESSLPSLGLPRNTKVDAQHRAEPPHALDAAKRFRQAQAALHAFPEWKIVVDLVVLSEDSLIDAGCKVTGYAPGKPAEAVALDRLRSGLKRLAAHFGLIDASECAASPAKRHSRTRVWRGSSDQTDSPAAA